jgi:hypothetical protein
VPHCLHWFFRRPYSQWPVPHCFCTGASADRARSGRCRTSRKSRAEGAQPPRRRGPPPISCATRFFSM